MVPPNLPLVQGAVLPCHLSIIVRKSGALGKNLKREVSMKLLEGRFRHTLIPTPEDHIDSRSILLGYPIHLTHHLINLLYPPKSYKSMLILMVKREKSYAIALTF